MMYQIERQDGYPLFYVTSPQHASVLMYGDFQNEAEELLKKLFACEITADQFPHIQMIPPYGNPLTVNLRYMKVSDESALYVVDIIDPTKNQFDNLIRVDGKALRFEVRP